jgi:outer membrane protein assembly factor BamE (lipoprotein component of BamABCDE complex)
MKKLIYVIGVIAALAFVSGCDTPEARIKKNPAAFDRLSPTDQQLVRQGRVAVGFDEDSVKLALGDPDRVIEHTDQQGQTVEWDYVNYRNDDGILLYRGYYHRMWGDPFFPYYMNFPSRQEYNQTKVMFRNGRVISVSEQTKG